MFAIRQLGCILALGSALLPTPATAEDLSPRMELCGIISDNSRRLSCFDDLFSRKSFHYRTPPDLVEGHGGWIGLRKQRIQGRNSSAMLLPAQGVSQEDVYQTGGSYQTESFIRVDCSYGKKSVYLHWPRDLGHRDIALDFTFDRGTSSREVWKVTLDGNVVRPKSNKSRQAFIQKLWDSNSLHISIPRNGLTQRYNLAGFQGMSNEMKDVCEWVKSM